MQGQRRGRRRDGGDCQAQRLPTLLWMGMRVLRLGVCYSEGVPRRSL